MMFTFNIFHLRAHVAGKQSKVEGYKGYAKPYITYSKPFWFRIYRGNTSPHRTWESAVNAKE